jgi:hypothetical protein
MREGGERGKLDKVDKALSGKRTLAQLPDEIVLNVLLPYIRVGADKHAHKRVRITRRRPVTPHLRKRLDIGAGARARGTILASALRAG